MTYWCSTKSPVHLFKRDYENSKVAKHLTENVYVDPVILANELKIPHLTNLTIRAYQRRLGVRHITNSDDYKKVNKNGLV